MEPTDRHGRPTRMLATVLAVIALVTTACGDDDDGDAAAPDAEGPAEAEQAAGSCDDPISIGWIPWDEDVAVTYLWQHLLEEAGHEVELTQLDVAPVYQGVAAGDLDLFLDAWLPETHADYWDQFSDDVEDLGVWYDQGTLNLAVPSYVDAETIGDLAGSPDRYGGRIVGIEPGAGLMRVTREEVIPTYGLDDYDLVEGSTPAMLAELQRALDGEEPVVVTLWHPHWAYSAYDIKDLEDPEGAMGDAEQLHAIARGGVLRGVPRGRRLARAVHDARRRPRQPRGADDQRARPGRGAAGRRGLAERPRAPRARRPLDLVTATTLPVLTGARGHAARRRLRS